MAVDLTAGVVGILNSGGQIVGTGFMASELGLILTCAHCVIDRDNRRPDKVGIIGVETKREYEAQVIEVGWRDPEAEDIAVLRLVDQRLPNFTPLPLGYSPKDIYEVSIRIFGFARSDSGVWASGKLLGRITSKNGNSLLQINASKISPGFTGAPVLDEATNTVIGMVSAYTSVGQSSRPDEPVFAIPAEVFIPIIQDVSVRINIQIEREAVHTAPEQLRTTSAESDASQSDRSNSLGYSSSTQSAFGWAECCRRELQVPEIPSQYLLAALCQEPHSAAYAFLSAFGLDMSRVTKELLGLRAGSDAINRISNEAKSLSAPEIETLPLSAPLGTALTEARRIAINKGSSRIRLRHLFAGLLNASHTSATQWLNAALSTDVLNWIKRTLAEWDEAESSRIEAVQQRAIRAGLYIAPTGVRDNVATADLLGFVTHADALASIILRDETKPPLVVGVYGPWGSGKSTFMQLVKSSLKKHANLVGIADKKPFRQRIRASVSTFFQQTKSFINYLLNHWWEWLVDSIIVILELPVRVVHAMGKWLERVIRYLQEYFSKGKNNPQDATAAKQLEKVAQPLSTLPDLIVVEYDAWAYADAPKLWAGLVAQIAKELDAQLGLKGRLTYLIKFRTKQLRNALFWGLIPVAVYLGGQLWSEFSKSAMQSPEIANWLTAITSGLWIVKLFQTQRQPVSNSVETLTAKFDTEPMSGVIHSIQDQVKNAISTKFPSPKPDDSPKREVTKDDIARRVRENHLKIVVLIDELDRCPLERVVDILEAIKLFLSEEIFIVLMAIDTRVAAEAIRLHYKDVKNPDLPHEYLEKIVQLPLQVPRADDKALKTYLESHMPTAADALKRTGDKGQIDRPPMSTPGPLPPIPAPDPQLRLEPPVVRRADSASSRPKFSDTPTEYNQIAILAEKFLESNPRRIKRLLNTYRYVKMLANEQKKPVDTEVWQKNTLAWLAFTMRWPAFMEAVYAARETLAESGKGSADIVRNALDNDKGEYEKPDWQEIDEYLKIDLERLKELYETAGNFLIEIPMGVGENHKDDAPNASSRVQEFLPVGSASVNI